MKTLIVVFALMAISNAFPAEEPQGSTKQKRGLLELDHGPTLLPAGPLLAKSYATPIIHAAPVVTKVFEPAPAPLLRSYHEPLITGPLITRGWGPHILGAKTLLPAPTILKAAPIYSAPILKAAPIISAPLYSKSLLAPAPLAIGSWGHGW